MKTDLKKKIILIGSILGCILCFVSICLPMKQEKKVVLQKDYTAILYEPEQIRPIQLYQTEYVPLPKVAPKRTVYDNLTLEELSEKLDRSLNSTLSGKGTLFASYSLELGLDPYLAVAIVLQETGCRWNCSYLVQACNNVGGQKGGPSCNGGAYKAYSTLDEGIQGFLDNLYYNYYAIGLVTAEQINTKYATSTQWSRQVNQYIAQIKAN